jgi:hypothetical protein
MTERSLYELFGVTRSASPELIRAAYVDLARQHHPDAPDGSHERMQQLNDAWAVLGKPAARAAYNSTLPASVDHAEVHDRWEPAHEDEDMAIEDDGGSPVAGVARAVITFAPLCFVVGLVIFGFGVVLQVSAVVQSGLMVLLVSLIAFLMAPFLAMGASINRGTVAEFDNE